MNGSFDGVEVLEAVACENLGVFPLRRRPDGQQEKPRRYLLAPEAIGKELMQVREVDGGGSVPQLVVRNLSEQAVLFVEGEELVGAKQNRVLNTSVLVGAGADCVIPVSCIEHGRWREISRGFGSDGQVSPSHLRHKLKRSVTRSLRRKRAHTSDQAEVWRDIESQQHDMKVRSKTAAMSDTFARYKDRIDRFRRALGCPDRCHGLVAVVDGHIVGMDLFDSDEVCARAWDRLLSGYAVDALRSEQNRMASPKRELVGVGADRPGSTQRELFGRRLNQQDIEVFLERLAESKWEEAPAVGEGCEYRLELGPHQQASMLYWQDSALHASATVEVTS